MALGLVHLSDLLSGNRVFGRESPGLAEALDWPVAASLPRHAGPCAAMGVVVPWARPELVERFAGWLRAARRIVLVWDLRGASGLDDPDLEELLAEEIGGAVGSLGNVADVIRWDGAPESSAALRAALLAAAEDVPGPAWEPETPGELLREPAPPGPWLEWEKERGEEAAAAVARSVCVRGGRPALLCREGGAFLDLTTGAITSIDPAFLPRTAIAPDGRRGVAPLGRGQLGFVGGAPIESHLWPFGVEAGRRFVWAAIRCTYDWFVEAPAGLSLLAGSCHDWPLGHAKKLYGYRDNGAVRIQVGASGDVCLSVFDVDAVVSEAVPLAWRRAGPAELVAWPPDDPRRALFFCPDWSFADGDATGAAVSEEDVRARPPPIGLGPDDEHRYLVGLDREVWRLSGETAERLGGPEQAYIVCDRDHAVVRRGAGVLLTAWDRHSLVRVGDAVVHEDVRSGARSPRASESGPIDVAVPVPWTPNAVLVAPGADPSRLRVRLV